METSARFDRDAACQNPVGNGKSHSRFHRKTGKDTVFQFECFAVIFSLDAGFRRNSKVQFRAG